MKQTRLLMGMPISVEIVDPQATAEIFDRVYAYFSYIDDTFSPFKTNSEVSLINQGKRQTADYSRDMQEVLALAEKTRRETDGYFNVFHRGVFNPSGLVKGWAIGNAALLVEQSGFSNFYVDAGGDVQLKGKNLNGQSWRIGIKNPFNEAQIVKALVLTDGGVATSGTYCRGEHIYNPKMKAQTESGVVSLTVIGPNVYEADRFATAAFAMGRPGIEFIDGLQGFEGYLITREGQGIETRGFQNYVLEPDEAN